MSELAERPLSAVLCKYYMAGRCTNPRCGFSHTFASLPNLVCKYYLAGQCKYGANCRYDHVKPSWSDCGKAAAAAGTSTSGSNISTPSLPATQGLSLSATPFTPSSSHQQNAWHQASQQQQQQQQSAQHSQECGLQLPSHLEDDWEGGEEGEWNKEGWQYYDSQGGACDDDGWEWEAFWGCGEADGEEGNDQGEDEGWGVGAFEAVEREVQAQQQASEEEPQGEDAVPLALMGPTEPAELDLCPWYTLRGRCPKNLKCELIHGEECQVCHKMALHPYNEAKTAAHLEECTKRHQKLMARLRSSEIECAICFDKVLSAPDPRDRRFGLMACDHAFCLKCIRGWRATSNADMDTAVRTCPVCRTQCYFITPSGVWPSSPEEKQEIIQSYKAKLATIDCVHFNHGEGTCPFGSSCFYRHVFSDGTPAPKEVRWIRTDEGSRVIGSLRLSSFFDAPHVQQLLNSAEGGSRRHLSARRSRR